MKRFVSVFLAACLVFSCTSGASAEEASAPPRKQQGAIRALYIREERLAPTPDMGYLYADENSRTLVPLRALAQAMGLTVSWDAASQKASIDGGLHGQMVFQVGSKVYTVGGEMKEMDTIPVVWAPGRIHIPLRFLVEGAGGTIETFNDTSGWFIHVFFAKGNAMPTPPSWAAHDYATFANTNVYQPENWAVIQSLRARAQAGENALDDLRAFRNAHKYKVSAVGNGILDDGFAYECLLIGAELAAQGHVKKELRRATDVNGDMVEQEVVINEFLFNDLGRDISNEQKLSALCWQARYESAMGLTDSGWPFNQLSPSEYLRHYEYPEDMPWLEYFDREALASEAYFDQVRTHRTFWKLFGPPVYYDGRQQPRNMAPYQSGDTTMFDLHELGQGLNWDVVTDKQYAVDSENIRSPIGTVQLKRYGDDWETDASGELVISERGFPRWRWGNLLQTIELTIGSSIAVVDGKKIDMGHPVEAKGYSAQSYIAVPQFFITNILGEQMIYNKERYAWFVGQDLDLGDCNLKAWALGMNAIVTSTNEKSDPTLLRMIARGGIDGTQVPGRIQAAYNLYLGWGITSAEDTRTVVRSLTSRTKNNDLLAWDMFRSAQVIFWSYDYGLIDLEEAMDLFRPAAQAVHDNFSGWEDACQNYMKGYLLFCGGNPENEMYQFRLSCYEKVKDNQEKMGVLLFDDALFGQPIRGLTGS